MGYEIMLCVCRARGPEHLCQGAPNSKLHTKTGACTYLFLGPTGASGRRFLTSDILVLIVIPKR